MLSEFGLLTILGYVFVNLWYLVSMLYFIETFFVASLIYVLHQNVECCLDVFIIVLRYGSLTNNFTDCRSVYIQLVLRIVCYHLHCSLDDNSFGFWMSITLVINL